MPNTSRSLVLGSALLACLALSPVPASQAASPPAVRHTPSALASRTIADRAFHAKVYFYGRDDENWPDKDENESRTLPDFNAVLGEGRREATYYVEPIKWGGECRFEVDPIKAQLLDDGTIRVSSTARLYEGTKDTTSNLRAYKYFSVDVPKKSTGLHYEVHLDWEGGDFGDLKFDFDNILFE